MLRKVKFYLDITTEEFMDYYRGIIQRVVVKTDTGQTVSFPPNILRPFVVHSGIHGWFELTYSDDSRLIDLVRLT